jgi:hypothetical protein
MSDISLRLDGVIFFYDNTTVFLLGSYSPPPPPIDCYKIVAQRAGTKILKLFPHVQKH